MIKLLILLTLTMAHSMGLWVAYFQVEPDTYFEWYVVGFHATSFCMSVVWAVYTLVVMYAPIHKIRKGFHE